MPSNARVVVACRPFTPKEIRSNKNKLCMIVNDGEVLVHAKSGTHSFRFEPCSVGFKDTRTPPSGGNQIMFNDVGGDLVESAVEGIHVSLVAYGQTGSGKTTAMFGMPGDPGLVQRLTDSLFTRLAREKQQHSGLTFKVRVTMLEIYNERVRDLLTEEESTGLKVREDPVTGPYVDGLVYRPVASSADVEALLRLGLKARSTAATAMNATSSRSHTIVQLHYESTHTREEQGVVTKRQSVINLVDLAGSERQAYTNATGDRLKEAQNINTSLSVLGKCVRALSIPAKQRGHVPYRDSTLTWLLKHSLGGRAKTVVVAAVSPCEEQAEETLSTLRYGDCMRNIQSMAVVNVEDCRLPNINNELMNAESAERALQVLKSKVAARSRAVSDQRPKPQHPVDAQGRRMMSAPPAHGAPLPVKAPVRPKEAKGNAILRRSIRRLRLRNHLAQQAAKDGGVDVEGSPEKRIRVRVKEALPYAALRAGRRRRDHDAEQVAALPPATPPHHGNAPSGVQIKRTRAGNTPPHAQQSPSPPPAYNSSPPTSPKKRVARCYDPHTPPQDPAARGEVVPHYSPYDGPGGKPSRGGAGVPPLRMPLSPGQRAPGSARKEAWTPVTAQAPDHGFSKPVAQRTPGEHHLPVGVRPNRGRVGTEMEVGRDPDADPVSSGFMGMDIPTVYGYGEGRPVLQEMSGNMDMARKAGSAEPGPVLQEMSGNMDMARKAGSAEPGPRPRGWLSGENRAGGGGIRAASPMKSATPVEKKAYLRDLQMEILQLIDVEEMGSGSMHGAGAMGNTPIPAAHPAFERKDCAEHRVVGGGQSGPGGGMPAGSGSRRDPERPLIAC